MKKLTAFTVFAAVMALSGTAMAQDATSAARTFSSAGITYHYTITTDRLGWQDLVGWDSRGMTFALHVEGTSVTGIYGRQPVAYSVRPRRRAPVEVATSADSERAGAGFAPATAILHPSRPDQPSSERATSVSTSQ